MSTTPDPWLQARDVFHAVAAQPADQRRTLLEILCDGDTVLQSRVLSLLVSDACDDPLFNVPPHLVQAASLDEAESLVTAS